MTSKTMSIVGFLAVLLACSQITHVECVDGQLFFLAYMNISTSNPNPAPGIQQIFISCINVPGNVTINYLPMNTTQVVYLNSSNSFRYTVVIYPDLGGALGTKLPVSIIIAATMPISVQTDKAEDSTEGGYLALPITQQSTNFFIASYTPRGKSSMFIIAAPYETCVDVQFYNGSQHYRIDFLTLLPGQQYSYSSAGQDYTGISVSSTQPIAVYGGLDCAYVPYDVPVTNCDHIIEQIPPVSQLGETFVMSSFDLRNPSAGFQYRVVATTTTTIAITTISYGANDQVTATVASPAVTIYEGNYYEGNAGRGSVNPTVVVINCSQPCLVMQYNPAYDMTETGTEPNKPDELMITVPAVNHYPSDVTFSTSQYYVANGNTSAESVNAITVVALQSNIASIMLDGTTAVSSVSGAITLNVNVGSPAVAYAVVFIPITPGYHTVTSATSTVTFAVFVYGFSPSSSPTGPAGYGYLGGYRYDYTVDSPVSPGPWIAMASPPAAGSALQATSPAPPATLQPLTAGNFPNFTVIWTAQFCTLVPVYWADLRTRQCSEAYDEYWILERFNPMQQYLTDDFIPENCAPGVQMNMSQLLYYSQYTCGVITITISIGAEGSSSASLQNILDCATLIGDYIQPFSNWVPNGGYHNVTDFLKTDQPYTAACTVLHMKNNGWDGNSYGWVCPYYAGVYGAVSGSSRIVAASFATWVALLCGVFFCSASSYLRWSSA